jgi:hypothetical protein
MTTEGAVTDARGDLAEVRRLLRPYGAGSTAGDRAAPTALLRGHAGRAALGPRADPPADPIRPDPPGPRVGAGLNPRRGGAG